jgi:hypothetical protein
MKRQITMALTGMALSFQVLGASPASRQAVEELLVVAKVQEIETQIEQQMNEVFAGALAQTQLAPQDEAIAAKYWARLNAVLRQQFSWEALKPQYVAVYTAVFTDQDVRQLIRLYRSPLGQRLLAATPRLINASGEIISAKMAIVLPKVEAIVQEMAAELERSTE